MRIDSTHRPWIIGTLAALVFCGALFVAVSASAPGSARGGSLTGIFWGAAGYALMLFAALLGLRKRVPVWRIGRAQTWMRGHLWLGLLSLPMILFHCAFTWKGPLASLLMILLFITVGSGAIGGALQHYVPRFMTNTVPLETIYEEIPHVRKQLCAEADMLAASISGTAESAIAVQTEIDPEIRSRFDALYTEKIRPMLARRAETGGSEGYFRSLRELLPLDVHPRITHLEAICEEERQLRRQSQIYGWLHGWLLIHVPLSVVLLVLGAVHAVVALRY